MTNGINSTLRRYFEANRLFMGLESEINAAIINTFLGVCIWSDKWEERGVPLTISELSERLGQPFTSTSRHLRYLGDFQRMGVPGMNLVRTDIYKLNRRMKTVSLTMKGKAMRDKVLYAFGEEGLEVSTKAGGTDDDHT